MNWQAIAAELAKPLDRKHVKPARKYGPKGDYIEAWHAQAEANRIFGFNGWCQEVIETACVMQSEREIGQNKDPGWGVTYTAKVRVTVGGVVKEDFGAGHGYDRDLGLAHESAIKESVSDAMKRAMKAFGNPFGLALYDKSQEHVVDVEAEAARERLITDTMVSLQSCTTMEELGASFQRAVALWKERGYGEFPIKLVGEKDRLKAVFSGDKKALSDVAHEPAA